MKALSKSHLTSTALIVVGLVVTGASGFQLIDREEVDVPINPFGVNRSPYGEVFAMAMQGPINTDVHMGLYGLSPDELAERRRKLAAEQPDNPMFAEPECAEGDACTGCAVHEPSDNEDVKGMLMRLEGLINDMRVGHVQRTNSRPANAKLQKHLRHQAEKKLFLAYRLDPSHYANYTALHMFLSEGITGVPERAANSMQLAEDTIEYCLSIDDDPRPALTAAAASTNILHLMFAAENNPEAEKYGVEAMVEEIKRLDRCIDQFVKLSGEWEKNGNWELISNRRLQDCFDRYEFIMKIREAALKTIIRIRSTYAK